MGLSVACAVAQSTTWQLLNFARRASAIAYIDNIAFCGKKKEVLADVAVFLTRCRAVKATERNRCSTEMDREPDRGSAHGGLYILRCGVPLVREKEMSFRKDMREASYPSKNSEQPY
eukprot:Tbor_TRINITY_DN6155_c1_g1::TRINITY_DN6155_c1_g1_i1::g.22658::m.22658